VGGSGAGVSGAGGLGGTVGELWEYGGVDPSAASGCIDPLEDRVNATVEAEVDGVRYRIRATNDPSLE